MDRKTFQLLLSVAIFIISLWQLEVLMAFPWDAHFDLPFHIAQVDKWWARDFLYLTLVIAYVLSIFQPTNQSYLEDKRKEQP